MWLNPNLSQFNTILDPQAWAKYKILTLEHVIINGELIPFHVLCTKFNGPAMAHFQYLQVAHAYRCQFLGQPIVLEYSELESTLRVKDLEKPTSQIYGSLLVAAVPELSSLLRKWVGHIPEMDEDDWRGIWDFPFSPLVSARDKLVQ